jgi:hypothetical protein
VTIVPVSDTSPTSRSTKDAFARVLLNAERGRFPLAALRAAAGGFRISPSGPMPDREVLAALVPERVLPFASGGSRKRWLKPSRGSCLGNRGGAPKGERAPLPALPRKRERAENKGARHTERCGTRWCACRRPASLLSREEFGMACVRQNSDANASRERCRLSAPRDSGGGGPSVARSAKDGGGGV